MSAITFTDDRLLPLVQDTALALCTTLTHDGEQHTVARMWPGLSTGEEALWGILAALADGRPPYPLGGGVVHLDAINQAVVREVLGDVLGLSL